MKRWRQPVPNPIDPPPGDYRDYVGYQKLINCNNGEVDLVKLDEHINMIMNDTKYEWEEIKPVDFRTISPGDRIRYTVINDKDQHLFRTGGWVTAVDTENYEWLSYRAHTQTSWCVQREAVVFLFVTRKKGRKKKERVHKFKDPGVEDKYNLYLLDENGIEQRVYSTPHKSKYDKFKLSDKYISAKRGELWEFEI